MAISLSGCFPPQYRTVYNLDPPTTAEGRACVFQCESAQGQCSILEEMRVDNCRDRVLASRDRCEATLDAEIDSCLANGLGSAYCYARHNCNHVVDNCGLTDKCITQYNRCFEICGGEVTAQTQCVANCD